MNTTPLEDNWEDVTAQTHLINEKGLSQFLIENPGITSFETVSLQINSMALDRFRSLATPQELVPSFRVNINSQLTWVTHTNSDEEGKNFILNLVIHLPPD